MTTFGVNFFGGWHGTRGEWLKYPLANPKWRHRVPFFVELNNGLPLTIARTSQQCMDAQLNYMNAYGIDYINFDFYPPEDNWISGTHSEYRLLNESFRKYLTSTQRGNVKCSLILLAEHLFFNTYHPDEWVTMVTWLRSWMSQPYWMTVLGGRPLLYFMTRAAGTLWTDAYDTVGGAGTALAAINSLRAGVLSDTGHDPYIVCMNDDASNYVTQLNALGLDALSRYHIQPLTGGGGEYHPNTQAGIDAAASWSSQLATGKDVVPCLTAGWDYKPNVDDYALSGAHDYGGENVAAGPWYVEPTPTQIADQYTAAKAFIDTNYGGGTGKTRADTMVIYAWDECSEGGYLVPTPYGPYGTQKLMALADARGLSAETYMFNRPMFNREIFNPFESMTPPVEDEDDDDSSVANVGSSLNWASGLSRRNKKKQRDDSEEREQGAANNRARVLLL